MKQVIYKSKKATMHNKFGIMLSPGLNKIKDDNIANQLINSGLVEEVKHVKTYEDKSMMNSSELTKKTKRKGFLS